MSQPKIFLDMDGVLADFVRSAFELFGRPYEAENVGWNFWEAWGIGEEAFWKRIESRQEFWRDIHTYHWTAELLTETQRFGEMAILSWPIDSLDCYSGKHYWAAQHAKGLRLNLVFDKSLLAAPGRILIDDNDANCERWQGRGGIAILFPQPWNANRGLTDNRIAYLRGELERATDSQFAECL